MLTPKAISIHEAGHAVFGYFLKVPTKKLYLYESAYQNKIGEMIPIIDRNFDILSITKDEFSNEQTRIKCIDTATKMLLILAAGDCAEKFYSNKNPDCPPDLTEKSDGYYSYLIIQRLCEYNDIKFDSAKFYSLIIDLIDTVVTKIKSDKELFEIINLISEKLVKSKKGYLSFGTITFTIAFWQLKKVICNRYKPYPFLTFDIMEKLK